MNKFHDNATTYAHTFELLLSAVLVQAEEIREVHSDLEIEVGRDAMLRLRGQSLG